MQIKNTKYFFIPFVLFLIFSIIILFCYSKSAIIIGINGINSPFLDFFFKNITYLGSGVLLAVLILVILFFDTKTGIIATTSSLLMLIVIKLMKTLIFAERPLSYFIYSFKTDFSFHYVDGVQIYQYSSFPSGHTATAFTTFLLLSIFLSKKNQILHLFFFALALLVGYSRMYLFQHFLIDVVVGALIGVILVCFSTFIINKFFPNLTSNGIFKSKTNE